MSEPQRQLDSQRVSELTRRAELWQRRYKALLEGLDDAVIVYNETGAIVTANAAAESLSGLSHDELITTNIRDLLGPGTLEGTAAREDYTADLELTRRDGSRRSVTIHAKVVSLAEEPLLVQCHIRLVLPKIKAPVSDHAETRFRLMTKNLTEMVLAYDMDRRLTFANPAAETLTGYSLAELEREGFICWVHADDRDRMIQHWDRLFEAHSFYEEEYRLVTKDGRVKWVAASWGPIIDDHGIQVGVQGRERDVTERRMAEETLRQSEHSLRVNEQRYRTLFEESPFPMWEEDFSRVKIYLDTLSSMGAGDLREHFKSHSEDLEECVRRVQILAINRAARDFYGAREKDELLANLAAIFDETAYEVFCEELATLADNQSIFKAEFQTRTLSGEPRTVSMIVSLAPTPNRDWSRVIVSFFDVTDRKRLEEQVLQSQKLESLGRLAGGIAHDFNNLLTVITGYADLLIHGLQLEDPVRRGLSEILNAGTRGAELTQQLLAFSRKQVVQMRPLNLNDVVREAEGMLKRVIGEDVDLAIDLDPSGAMVKGDRGQMHQVLMNLVINGREAMPHGGRLNIETRNLKPYLLLRVSDTGIGMDTETKTRVFEPFFTTKHPAKGTGLGLATVFGIVTQAGGHVSVESEPGIGSAFSVYFPHVAGHAKPEAARVRPLVSKGSGAVLVVEDQPEVRTLTCTIVRNLGYEVLEAVDGAEALVVAERHAGPIRLLISDVIMPGMNGPELAAQLALTQPQMKTIFMSGYTDRIMSEAGEIDTSIAFVQKPFTPDHLGAAVHRVLS